MTSSPENMANDDDQRSSYALPSLLKSAFYACDAAQRKAYYEREVPVVDIQECCRSLFRILKFNSESHCFDAAGDRRGAYAKVKSRLDSFAGSVICEQAARFGHIECMKLGRALGVPWHVEGPPNERTACTAAAQFGQISCLCYAYENGSPIERETLCYDAAMGGSLECLRYAREVIGCPWDVETCAMAAFCRHHECLRYAKEAGCPWNEVMVANAAAGVY